MKKRILVVFTSLLFISCGNNGEIYADEFCQCLETKNVLGCKEVMNKHLQELDEEETSLYLQKTNKCIQNKGF